MTFVRKLLGLPEKTDGVEPCVVCVNNITNVSTFTGHSFDLNHATGVGTCTKCGLQLVDTEMQWLRIEKMIDNDGVAITRR